MPTLENAIIIAILLASPWCVVSLWRRDIFRPGSLARLAAAGLLRNPAPVHGAVWLAACIATLLAASVGAAVTGSALGIRPADGAPASAVDPGAAALAELGAYSLAVVVGLFCAGLIARTGRSAGVEAPSLGLGARGRWGREARWGLGGLLLVLPLCLTVGVAISQIASALGAEPPRVGHTALREMVDNRYAWPSWLKGFLAIVGAPVVEELIYRVFLQSAIISALARLRSARTGELAVAAPNDVFWGITLSTAGFVLPHAAALSGPASWNTLPSLAILGIGLGVVYERTRSPIAPIAMHMGFNAVNVLAAMATVQAAAR